MVKKSYDISIKKNVVCKKGSTVIGMFDTINPGQVLPIKSIIGKEKKRGQWGVFLDEESADDSNLYGVILSCKDDKGNILGDEDIAEIISGDYEILLSSHEENVIEGKLNSLIPDSMNPNRGSSSVVNNKLQALIQQKINDGSVTKEDMDKRMEVFKANRITDDEHLMMRIIKGYRKYSKPTHIPSTVYVDPYLDQLLHLNGEGIIAEGLRASVSRNAMICEGEKSVGKNVYLETIAWLMNMPLRLITFSRNMSPSSIYGEKTTDNSASETLKSKKALEMAEGLIKAEAGDSQSITTAAAFEVLKAQAASVSIVIDQSELYDWLTDGGMLVFNEMNMAEANFFASFTNQLLDGTGFLFIPGRGEVGINPDCVLFGTQNADYQGVEQQNEATMSRFGCIVFKQPETIKGQLVAATNARLKKDGYEDISLDDKYYTQAEKFYKQCRSASEKEGELTNACLNIRGFVRALVETAEGCGFCKLKRNIVLQVINTCPTDERMSLEAILDQIVTL